MEYGENDYVPRSCETCSKWVPLDKDERDAIVDALGGVEGRGGIADALMHTMGVCLWAAEERWDGSKFNYGMLRHALDESYQWKRHPGDLRCLECGYEERDDE